MSLPTRRLLVAGLVLAAGTALFAPSAQAAPGLTGKLAGFDSTALSDTPTKTVRHYCPPGTVVISGGAYVEGPAHVSITSMRPVPAGNYYEASARNPGPPAPWTLSAYGLCADPPPGLQYVSASSAPAAGVERVADVSCPAGTRVVGLGARAALERGRNVTLVQFTPDRLGTGARARSVAAQGGEPQNWTATAYAVCAAVSTTVAFDISPTDSTTPKYAGGDCGPGGVAASGGSIATGSGEVHFTQVYPDAWLQEGVVSAAEDQDGYGGDWALRLYAICA